MTYQHFTNENDKATCADPAYVELPTDEINITASEAVQKVIDDLQVDNPINTTLTHADGTSEEIQVFPYPSDPVAEARTMLEGGKTVDFKSLNEALNATGFELNEPLIRDLPDVEDAEVLSCACTENDTDADTMLIVHDLSERLAALEARIALYNTKASHKI